MVVDNPFETVCSKDGLAIPPWVIPRNITESLQLVEELLSSSSFPFPGHDDWKVPAVRVVRNEEGIVGVENVGLELRCRPNNLYHKRSTTS